MFKKIAAAVSAFLFSISAAQAADYKIEFSISGFNAVAPGMDAAPFDAASGTIIFSASSPESDWDAVKTFSLTIGNVSYSLTDAEFANYGYYTNVGGIPGGENILNSGTNDFAFSVFHDQGSATLSYSSAAGSGIWYRDLQISILPDTATSVVPEPETYAMLLAGLGLMGVAARRRRS